MNHPRIILPTLCLDEEKCRRNIRRMAQKARNKKLFFRPHFKTHQSLEIGSWFKEEGVTAITVSSFSMAKYFTDEWDDITVAFPVNILEVDTINELASRVNLNILVESVETVDFLNENLGARVGFFIKIDVGSHRTGISPSNTEIINAILAEAQTSDRLIFKGFLSHAGHTYQAKDKQEVLDIHRQGMQIMHALKAQYKDKWPEVMLSVGDTPSCSIAEDFSGMDEIRPGNFVFYDLMQAEIGACHPDDIALTVACPVVALHPERNKIVLYGGAVHLSKDNLENKSAGKIYGRLVKPAKSGWEEIMPDFAVTQLSQEHGIITAPFTANNFKIGDLVMILPVHSCLTADLHSHYLTTTGRYISKTRSV